MSSRAVSVIPSILALALVGCGTAKVETPPRGVLPVLDIPEELAEPTAAVDEQDPCREVWKRIDEGEPLPSPGPDVIEYFPCGPDSTRLSAVDEAELRRLIAGVARAIDTLDLTALACVSDPVHGLMLEGAHIASNEFPHMAHKTIAYCGADCEICEPEHFPAISAYFEEWGRLSSRAAQFDVGCYRNAPGGLEDAPHASLMPPLKGEQDNADGYGFFFERHGRGPSGQARWFLRAAVVHWHKPRCPG